MADTTNAGIASAAGTAPGDMSRQFAIKRLQRLQRYQGVQTPGRVQPPVPPVKR